MSGFLFMSESEDPEMDVWMARGNVRIYDATRPPTEAEVRLIRERDSKAKPALPSKPESGRGTPP